MARMVIDAQSPAYHHAVMQGKRKIDRDLQTTMTPTDLPSSAQLRPAIDTCLLPRHTAWVENVGTHQLCGQPAAGATTILLVCGGQMGEKEKWSSLSIMKRDGTGDLRVVRNSLM